MTRKQPIYITGNEGLKGTVIQNPHIVHLLCSYLKVFQQKIDTNYVNVYDTKDYIKMRKEE